MKENVYENPAVIKLMRDSNLTYEQKMIATDAILAAVYHGIQLMGDLNNDLVLELPCFSVYYGKAQMKTFMNFVNIAVWIFIIGSTLFFAALYVIK